MLMVAWNVAAGWSIGWRGQISRYWLLATVGWCDQCPVVASVPILPM